MKTTYEVEKRVFGVRTKFLVYASEGSRMFELLTRESGQQFGRVQNAGNIETPKDEHFVGTKTKWKYASPRVLSMVR